jgi:hypothetical protein
MRWATATLMGFGLIALWAVTIAAGGPDGFAWLDGVAGVVAIIAAFKYVRDRPTARTLVFLDGVGLSSVGLLGLAYAGPGWVHWCNVGFGCALLVLAGADALAAARYLRLRQPERRFRA